MSSGRCERPVPGRQRVVVRRRPRRHQSPPVGRDPVRRDFAVGRSYTTGSTSPSAAAIDRTTPMLSPLDLVPRGMTPTRIDADGRIWLATNYGHAASKYTISWTDDDGQTWQTHRVPQSSSCAGDGRPWSARRTRRSQSRPTEEPPGPTPQPSSWLGQVPLPDRYRENELRLFERAVTTKGTLVAPYAATDRAMIRPSRILGQGRRRPARGSPDRTGRPI